MANNSQSSSFDSARSALIDACELRWRFNSKHGERSLLQEYRVPIANGGLDPYRPNYFLAYCRLSDAFSFEKAVLLYEIQYRLDELNDLMDSINDHSPRPFEFEVACVEEIENERELLTRAITELDVKKYWDALLRQDLMKTSSPE